MVVVPIIEFMKTRRGLYQLYQRFGTETFTGESLRQVMTEVMGGPNQPRVGWVASTHLGRLVKSGAVTLVTKNPEAKAAWGHTYQLSQVGLDYVGHSGDVDQDEGEYDESKDPFTLAMNEAKDMMSKMVLGKRHKVSRKTGLINPDAERPFRWEGLRIAMVSGWVELTVSITPQGQEWLAEQSESEA
jgi:hypothetical protein